jgi:hypothetical protein
MRETIPLGADPPRFVVAERDYGCLVIDRLRVEIVKTFHYGAFCRVKAEIEAERLNSGAKRLLPRWKLHARALRRVARG